MPGEDFLKYWKSEFEEQILFKEKIIVNGNIYSIISEGSLAFQNESNIILYSSGLIYINSSLNCDSSAGSSLKIITGNSDFFSKPANSGKVIVNKIDGDKKKVLSVSVIASETLINNNQELTIKGSIYTKEIDNKGKINISPYYKKSKIDNFFTTKKYCYIKSFIVSFNGEIYNE